MFTTPMVRILAVVLEQDVDSVTEVLLDQGVLHFMNVNELRESWSDRMKPLERKVTIPRISETRRRIEGLLRSVDEPVYSGDIEEQLHQDLKSRKPLDLDEENVALDRIAGDLNRIRDRQRNVQQEITSLADILVQVRTYGIGVPKTGADAYSFIAFRIGALPSGMVETLRDELDQIPSVVIPMVQKDSTAHLIVIHMKRDTGRVGPILERLAWKDIEFSHEYGDLKSDVSGDIEKRIAKLNEEDEQLEAQKRDVVMKNRDVLVTMWHHLVLNEQFYKIQSYFRKTSRTVMFSGWLPSARRGPLVESIGNATGGRCYIEWHEPDELEADEIVRSKPPVQLHNPKLLAPFQMLVTGYTMPEYGTIDPTFFVGFAYLVMFGLMFADVGQGAVLVLIGGLSARYFRGSRESTRNLMKLIAWCGTSAALFGVLFGSYFGMPWFPPLWFDFHGVVMGTSHTQGMVNDLFDILALAIYFGIVIIGVGLLFNWINLIRLRRWGPLIFDKGGIAGGWMYGGGIYAAFYLIRQGYKQLPYGELLLVLLGIPALLLFFKSPILAMMKGDEQPRKPITLFSFLNFGMAGIVELLEVFSGYLSNTLSFLRVAGLGIAHVSLMTAFFELARMATPGGSGQFTTFSILILIFGNVLVIGLEGLSAGIQSLRLHYYEFFTKFLRGSGMAYAPVSLRRVSEEA